MRNSDIWFEGLSYKDLYNSQQTTRSQISSMLAMVMLINAHLPVKIFYNARRDLLNPPEQSDKPDPALHVTKQDIIDSRNEV